MCRSYLVPVLLACVFGCASGSRVSQPSSSGLSTSFRDVLTGDEIRAAPRSNALEAIESLRPWFARASRGEPPAVYVDHVRYDRMSDLRSIGSETIVEIRFVRPLEASSRTLRPGRTGAIVITTAAHATRAK